MPVSNEKSSAQVAAVDIAHRAIPDATRITVPQGEQAFVIREGEGAETMLPPGEQRIRRRWNPRPEVYLVNTEPALLPLWITEIYDVDSQGLNLGWFLQVQVVDARPLWQQWMRHVEEDDIPLPAGQISARLRDPVQELIKPYRLSAMRSDENVRKQVAGQLSLIVRDELKNYGLEIAGPFDAYEMRLQTDAERAQAEMEQEALARMAKDAKLQTAIEEVENIEVMAQRIGEWLEAQGLSYSDAEVMALATRILSEDVTPVQALSEEMEKAEKLGISLADKETPSVVHFRSSQHSRRWHILRDLSRFLLVATVIAGFVLALVAEFEPQWFETVEVRNQTIAMVAGIAMLCVLAAWIIDQAMRWEARRTARRILRDADLNHSDLKDDRTELRHLLSLIGAILGIIAATFVLRQPEYHRWFEFAGAVIALFVVFYAVHLDWVRNIEQSHTMVRDAHRRVASLQLSDAERERQHGKLQTDLAVEAEIAAKRLDEAASLIFRNLRNRQLYITVKAESKRLDALLPSIASLETPAADRPDGEWLLVDEHMTELREDVEQCSTLSNDIAARAQNSEPNGIVDKVGELQRSVTELDEAIHRWKKVV